MSLSLEQFFSARGASTSNLATKLELRRRELPFCPAPEFLVMPAGPVSPGDDYA